MMTTPEKRKMTVLLFLPLALILFAALGFYAVGGGRDAGEPAGMAANRGINPVLPGAQLPQGTTSDKLAVYEQAQRDSASARNHPVAGAFAALGWDTAKYARLAAAPADANAAKIQQRLAALHQQLSQAPPEPARAGPLPGGATTEILRLEQQLREKQESARTPDPQMTQLSAMLDKIREIQHPALVQEKLQQAAALKAPDSAFKAVPAIIDGNQKVAPGGVVRLKLRDSLQLQGMSVPAGQELFGSCSITNQRLLLEIKNIRLGTSIIPVNLTVFALDGMAGIPAPEAELGEAAGQGTAGALESMQFLSGDYSIGTQAATAGISAARGLLSKKVKKIRVRLRGGQAVLLRRNNR